MTQYNRIKQPPATLGNTKKTIRPRANQSKPMFFEKDLQLPGIVKETNNYTPNVDGCGDYDLDACLFIQLAGITNTTQKEAINTLVLSAKSNGWWNLCKAIYPMVGGTESSCKLNLKDPRDLDEAFRLTFINVTSDPIFSDTGVQFDDASYAKTYLIPSVELTQDDTHISYYSRTNSAGGYHCEIGVNSAGNQVFTRSLSIFIKYINNNYIADHYQYPLSRITIANSDTLGLHLSSRINSGEFTIFKNGNTLSTNFGDPGTIPNKQLYLGALNDFDEYVAYLTNRECGFATIGYGINSTVALLMYNDVQSFQTTLGRQV